MVLVGTSGVRKYNHVVLEEKFRLLGRKSITLKVEFSELWLVPLKGQIDKHRLKDSMYG